MRICIFRKVAWYTRAVDLAQFYRKNARGTQKNKGTASIFAWFCTRSRGHGQLEGPDGDKWSKTTQETLPFCQKSSTILISRRHRAWRIRQPSAQRERRSSADGLLCLPCAMCRQWNYRFIDDRRDLPIWISSMEIQSNIKTGFTTTSIGTNSQNL